jgi:MtN3 and saliva related transmembrane protein
MQFITIIGVIAALCSVLSFAPQAWKVIRTRETKDLSAVMYGLTVLAFASWSAYGIALRQWPLVASNSICFVLSSFILVMIMMPKAKKERVADLVAEKKP